MVKKSFISKYHYVPEQVYIGMEEYLKDYSKEARHLVYHIIDRTLASYKEEKSFYVPIPSTCIAKELGQKIKVTDLEESGLIIIKPLNNAGKTYSRYNHTCREYTLPDHVWDKYFELSDANKFSDSFVNIFNGRPRKVSTNSKDTLGSRGVVASALVSKAVNAMSKPIVNIVELRKHINSMSLKARQSKVDKFRYLADLTAYINIMSSAERINETLITYSPNHATQMSGRISELGSGLQSCSRAMKHAAFSGIPNVHNYDLKSSQVLGLKQQFEEAGISTEAVTEVLRINKAVKAAELGLTTEAFKKIVIEVIMGAALPAFEKAGKCKFDNSVYDDIIAGAIGNVEEVYNRVYTWLQPLKTDLDKWHDMLVTNAFATKSRKSYINNRCEVGFYLGDYSNKQGKIINKTDLRRKLAAYFLQGQEAGFIHHLTVLSKKYGFTVLSNQHDGLVTQGEIPAEAVVEASQLSGLKYAQLEKKNFVDGLEFHKPEVKEVKEEAKIAEVKPKETITKPEVKPTIKKVVKPTYIYKARRKAKPLPTEWEWEELTDEAKKVLFG